MEQIKILDEYETLFEYVKIPIKIYSSSKDFMRRYEVETLKLGKGTEQIVDKIKEHILREGLAKEFLSLKNYSSFRSYYIKRIQKLLDYYLPSLDLEIKEKLVTSAVQKSLNLGFVGILVSDNQLEEIAINGKGKFIMVYHRRFGWLKTNLKYTSDIQINNTAVRIALENRKIFSNLYPLLDTHTREGHRVNATLNPVSTKGSTITIRKFSEKPWTITDLIQNLTSSSTSLALLWVAIENEASIIVSGGTATGKTSFLNAISSFIPAEQRVISVEDTREIKLPNYSHWVSMETRVKNQEGKGEITMLDLIVNSLRMRPDRVIVGEIRKEEEAQTLFEAMRTGHSVYATFHANTAQETLLRLSSPPIRIPRVTLNALDLIVVLHRYRKSGRRVAFQIAEVDEAGRENVILRYNFLTNKHIFQKKPTKLLEKLHILYGTSEREFFKLIEERAFLLNMLVKYNINTTENVGRVINQYYKSPKKVIQNFQRRQ